MGGEGLEKGERRGLLVYFTYGKRNLRNAGNGKKMEKTKLKRKLKRTMKFTPQH